MVLVCVLLCATVVVVVVAWGMLQWTEQLKRSTKLLFPLQTTMILLNCRLQLTLKLGAGIAKILYVCHPSRKLLFRAGFSLLQFYAQNFGGDGQREEGSWVMSLKMKERARMQWARISKAGLFSTHPWKECNHCGDFSMRDSPLDSPCLLTSQSKALG